jgi:hypothetical protein
MKSIIIKITIATAILMSGQAYSQGFVNLNFEGATITLVDPQVPQYIYASNSIPGWTAYLNGTPQWGIGYDTVSEGGATVCLEDTNANSLGPVPLQGIYSVLLEGASGVFGSNPTTASIGQTGTIPNTAQSFTFWGNLGGTVLVSFNGQNINFSAIANGPNYTTYGANISAYAGQTGQLLFTATLQSGATLDNIQFSSSPIPEPSTFALAALGGLLLSFRRWRNFSR